MEDFPAVFRKPTSQIFYLLAVPLTFFVFVLVYHPFNLIEEWQLGRFSFGVNLTLIACIIFGSMALMRSLFYLLRERISNPAYYFWCLLEITVAALFVALYVWLMRRCVEPYFVELTKLYGQLFAHYTKPLEEPSQELKMRFYDERKNLKLVVTTASVLYIAAQENYVQVFYLEGERVRDYLVRASMRSIEERCAENGLKRCHRSYYLNPAHVKTLRREKEGVIVAELDVAGLEVQVTKRYFDDLVAIL